MKTAIVGWRGMVGSVLMQRMAAERDLDHVDPVFFSTSAAGQAGPQVSGRRTGPLQDANDLEALAQCDVVVTCQGGDYTNAVHPQLRAGGWKGYWIDAASALRMKDDAVIILDPVNRNVIDAALQGRRARLRRRQLHRLADDDGARRPVPRGPHRVDHVDDVPGRLGRRCPEHARTRRTDGCRACVGGVAAGRPGQRDPRHRPCRHGQAPRSGFSQGAVRRAARGQPDPVDRQGSRQRPEPRGVEGQRRDQQDPRPQCGQRDPGRRHLRAHRRNALPQPGDDDQAQARPAAAPRSNACLPPATTGCATSPIRAMPRSPDSRPPR